MRIKGGLGPSLALRGSTNSSIFIRGGNEMLLLTPSEILPAPCTQQELGECWQNGQIDALLDGWTEKEVNDYRLYSLGTGT